jgi:precorrin-4 methylase
VEAIGKARVILSTRHARDSFADYLKGKEWIEFPGMRWKALHRLDESERLERIRKTCSMRSEAREKIKTAVEQGKIAAVLLPGDPGFFSPIDWFAKNIPAEQIEIVPGISAVNAASAALKRSLVTGTNTESVIITAPEAVGGLIPHELTGRRRDTIEELSRPQTNLVFFMALFRIGGLIARLRKKYPDKTPAAVVYKAGFRDGEKVVSGTLGDIEQKIGEEKERFMGLFLVGPFLNISDKSLWERVQENIKKNGFGKKEGDLDMKY